MSKKVLLVFAIFALVEYISAQSSNSKIHFESIKKLHVM